MVERKILYYPTMLPTTEWLKWAVLYWDKVSSIIPLAISQRSEKGSPFFTRPYDKRIYESVKYLGEEGVYEPTRPSAHALSGTWWRGWEAHKKLLNELKQFLKSNSFMRTVRRDWVKESSYRIHKEKFSLEAIDFLENEKLAMSESGNSGLFQWFFVEKNIFLLYMALLAKNLADINPDYVIVGTDWSEYETILFESNLQDDGFPSLRTKFLDILPIPRKDVTLKQIVQFRKENMNRLLSLREEIDAFQREVSLARDQAEIKQILVQYGERIKRERAKLKESMKDSDIKTVSSLFSSLVDIKSPAFIETIGFSITKIPLNISVPIIAGTAALQIASTWINRRNEQTAKIREAPFSYLYCAEQKKII